MSENKPKEKINDNIIFIGAKPFMNYVTAVVMQVTTRKQDEVKVIARGKFISKAVDVAEVSRNRFLEGENKVIVKDTKIDSEKFTKKDENGKEREISVSTIEITLSKNRNQ